MSGGAGSGSSVDRDFPGVYIGGFLQQQRVFAHVDVPGHRNPSTEVVVFPTDWREQRRIIIASLEPLFSFSDLTEGRPALDTSYFITDFSEDARGVVKGFHIPNTFQASSFSGIAIADANDAHARRFISWTLHDVRGGHVIASFSTPTQPPIL
jgi:hypothetical protein